MSATPFIRYLPRLLSRAVMAWVRTVTIMLTKSMTNERPMKMSTVLSIGSPSEFLPTMEEKSIRLWSARFRLGRPDQFQALYLLQKIAAVHDVVELDGRLAAPEI